MKRNDDFIRFMEHDSVQGRVIEPQDRYENLSKRILDIQKTYAPKIIVKVGAGQGDLLMDLAGSGDAYIVLVEPSWVLIEKFIKENKDRKGFESIRIINGDFFSVPVDYYAADLLICVDILSILDSAVAIDEFRRILRFEGHLFLSSIVIDDEDLEGVYDDFMRNIFPLHNDYYTVDDFNTVMKLNEFKLLKESVDYYEYRPSDDIEYFKQLYPGDNPENFIADHRKEFEDYYKYDGENMKIPYYTGVFLREKPESERPGYGKL